jgi:hypothetical protein
MRVEITDVSELECFRIPVGDRVVLVHADFLVDLSFTLKRALLAWNVGMAGEIVQGRFFMPQRIKPNLREHDIQVQIKKARMRLGIEGVEAELSVSEVNAFVAELDDRFTAWFEEGQQTLAETEAG